MVSVCGKGNSALVSCLLDLSGDGAKVVAKRKLQQTKLLVKPVGASSSELAQASSSAEAEAASPIVAPKVRCLSVVILYQATNMACRVKRQKIVKHLMTQFTNC